MTEVIERNTGGDGEIKTVDARGLRDEYWLRDGRIAFGQSGSFVAEN